MNRNFRPALCVRSGADTGDRISNAASFNGRPRQHPQRRRGDCVSPRAARVLPGVLEPWARTAGRPLRHECYMHRLRSLAASLWSPLWDRVPAHTNQWVILSFFHPGGPFGIEKIFLSFLVVQTSE